MLALDDAAIEELRGLLCDLHYDAVLRSLHPQYFYWLFPPPEAFDAAAEATKDGCPISRALAGNVALSVEATLETDG